MLLISVDPAAPEPIYRQICARVAALVEDGTLRPGDRLPPTRALAAALGVHRATVVRAYDELAALGYVESRPGSYTTVRRRARPPATARARTPAAGRSRPDSVRSCRPLIAWSRLGTPAARAARAAIAGASPVRRAPSGDAPAPDSRAFGSPAPAAPAPPDTIDLSRLAPDPALAPDADLRRCLRQVLARQAGAALDYAEAEGCRPLREAIAARMRVHGIAAEPEEIVVTAGAQHGLDLALRLLCRPGDPVVVEAPSYGMAHALLRLHGVAPVEVPMREDGLDLDALERALARRRPRLVYTMPNFHNPTGITTSQAHRERLLALCERNRTPLLEDGFEEELKYFGQAVLPIKSMDERGVVLYLGTFSKTVFPGLRLGWIAAPLEAAARLGAVLRASCLAGNTLAQAAVARYCTSGDFEAYLRRAHRAYRARMQAMLSALARHLPPGVAWTRPLGGYTLWLTLPLPARREAEACARLLRAGVRVAPGRPFFARAPAAAHARLSISCVPEERIEEAGRRLGSALASILGPVRRGGELTTPPAGRRARRQGAP